MRAQPFIGLFSIYGDDGREVYVNRSFVVAIEPEFNGTSVNRDRCLLKLIDGTTYHLDHQLAVVARWAANLEAAQ